ncbi:glycosyltransferase family 2 protein [Pseudomonas frederiksbergensis]|uniref:glycosyltransferase family 2 protein n=1 Tax=Pseudomonas frederiksbergensis TaxID=104087 RepID=UPI002DB9F033|nr:glycosyltransferase family 2 protein [Pseudomonas frederiksbergensis]WRV66823.1 glycosyltransferase family 2 protein [Pseudomonas frederiksbergensis]
MQHQPPPPHRPNIDLSIMPEKPLSTCSVAILMCTYNGQAYLEEQINSLIAQTHQNWTLYISDDGSTDGTVTLLNNYRDLIKSRRIHIYSGPRQGFAENFMSLIRNSDINAEFYAFSDQDDIWFDEKLERSIKALKKLPVDQPALYCSRTRLIDKKGKVIGFSPAFNQPPAFQNALIQSIAGANTMLLNNAARNLLKKIPSGTNIVAHDWLSYLLTTAHGGKVIYDPEPTLDYRQHEANVIGANSSLKERVIRIGKLFDGRFQQWTDSNLRILRVVEDDLPSVNRQMLDEFRLGRNSSIFTRLRLMKRSGIYRQTIAGNITLILAICLNKI